MIISPQGRSRWPLVVTVCAAVLVALQKGVAAGHPGNFLLFRYTFHRLLAGTNIYYPPPGEMTGYLYSPTFALLFAPFAVWPVPVGLLLWDLANALALYVGLTRLLPSGAARGALAIVFLDLVRSLQNSQSNALVAGLILAAFIALERRAEARAAAAVMAGAFIKIFPIAAGVLGVAGPRRWRFIAWSLVLGAALAAAPLLVLSPHAFAQLYRQWWMILRRDSGLQGQSVMRILADWFGLTFPNWTVQLAGTLVLLAPLCARPLHRRESDFRVRLLCSLLIFLVIFNHQAESASFVIATTGVAVWYLTTNRAWWRTGLLALTLLGVSVPGLFFVPYRISHDVVGAHALNAFPCLLVWVVIQIELWRWSRSASRDPGPAEASGGEAGTLLK